jgi:hypothetical protein
MMLHFSSAKIGSSTISDKSMRFMYFSSNEENLLT